VTAASRNDPRDVETLLAILSRAEGGAAFALRELRKTACENLKTGERPVAHVQRTGIDDDSVGVVDLNELIFEQLGLH